MLDYPNLMQQCIDYLWFKNSVFIMLSFLSASISLMYCLRREKKEYGTVAWITVIFSVLMLLICTINNFCLLQWPQAVVIRYLLGG